VPDTLPVHLNRDTLHSLEVPAGIETDGSFDVVLENHGEAIHVHVHLDDALSEVARLDANNHYVKADGERAVRVHVAEPRELHGKVKIVTSYGAETRYVDIDLHEPVVENDTVTVDESLTKPQPREPESQDSASTFASWVSPLVVLGILAMALAVGVAALVPSMIVTAVAVVVVLSVLGGHVVSIVN
jgi:hypothetical protein